MDTKYRELIEIKKALGQYYIYPKYIKDHMKQAAREICLNGKEYRFHRTQPSNQLYARAYRIFKRDGEYKLRSGWSRSSDKCYN